MKVIKIGIEKLILSFQSVDERQHLRDILIGLHFIKTFQDVSLLVDHERRARHPHHLFAIHHLFLPDAVGFDCDAVRIGKQRKIQALLGDEFLMRCRGVFGDADYLEIPRGQFREMIGLAAGLLRAARGAVFGIKINDDLLA